MSWEGLLLGEAESRGGGKVVVGYLCDWGYLHDLHAALFSGFRNFVAKMH